MHGRIWAAACGALMALVLAAPASAQFSPGARTLGEPYLFLQHIGNGGYDVQHYDITIDYDPIAHSMVSSAAVSEASKKIDGVVKKTGEAIESGQQTFASANQTFTSANQTFTTAKSAADDLKKAIGDLRSLLQQARQGKGALAALISDREMAENLRSLVSNLRRSGILWYKDRPPADSSSR